MFNLIQVDFTLVKFLTLQYNVIIRATNRNESIDKEYEMEKHENQAPLVHDGISPIIVTETEETAQFNQLWSYLVPSCGRAKTAQGELIRIAGRVQHEFLDNGGINWDDDFRKMLHTFPKYLRLGNAFHEDDIKSAEILTNLLIVAGDEGRIDDFLCSALCACAVAWVQQNPEVIAPLEADYNR